jgi:hypothetical protein
MESMVSLEKHVGAVEQKISVIFNSINGLIDYSSKSGGTLISISSDIKELKENLIYKEDLISQLSILHDEIANIINIINENNKEFINSLTVLSERIDMLDKKLLGNNNPETSSKKGIFKR